MSITCLFCGAHIQGTVIGDKGQCPECNGKYEVVRGWTPEEYLKEFGQEAFEDRWGAKTLDELYLNSDLYDYS